MFKLHFILICWLPQFKSLSLILHSIYFVHVQVKFVPGAHPPTLNSHKKEETEKAHINWIESFNLNAAFKMRFLTKLGHEFNGVAQQILQP